MKYIVIKAPNLTDEDAANLENFFHDLAKNFSYNYQDQIKRYHYISLNASPVQQETDFNFLFDSDETPF